jgi:hypothetical protein
VQVAAPDAEIATSLNPAPDELAAEILQPENSDRRVLSGRTMDSRIAVNAALKAGVLGVFIGAIPVIGIVLTGALAVFFYRRKSRFVLPVALGARLGGAAGVVVFSIGALLTIAIIVLHAQQQCIDFMVKGYQRFGVNTADPEIQARIHDLFTPSGLAVNFVAILVLASIGGALASLFMRRRNTRV